MKIDLHIHEKTYSLDSQASLEDIIIEARRKGLDAITITDHDNNDIKEYAKEVSKHENFPIFVGVEYLTQQGDIVAFGIEASTLYSILKIWAKSVGLSNKACPKVWLCILPISKKTFPWYTGIGFLTKT